MSASHQIEMQLFSYYTVKVARENLNTSSILRKLVPESILKSWRLALKVIIRHWVCMNMPVLTLMELIQIPL